MKKKRSKGITILGIISIIYGLLTIPSLLFVTSPFLDYSKQLKPVLELSSNLYYVSGVLLQLLYIIAGILILQLKESGRTLVVNISILKILFYFSYLIFVGPSLFLNIKQIGMEPGSFRIFQVAYPLIYLFFFTRPSVKGQFK